MYLCVVRNQNLHLGCSLRIPNKAIELSGELTCLCEIQIIGISTWVECFDFGWVEIVKWPTQVVLPPYPCGMSKVGSSFKLCSNRNEMFGRDFENMFI